MKSTVTVLILALALGLIGAGFKGFLPGSPFVALPQAELVAQSD